MQLDRQCPLRAESCSVRLLRIWQFWQHTLLFLGRKNVAKKFQRHRFMDSCS